MFFDPLYLLMIAPCMLLAAWAQQRVHSAFARGKQQPASSGLSGAETAQQILDMHRIHDVRIEAVNSFLGDHYDSRHKVLRLSPDVYHGRHLAALGIAAHEVGHAIQHATAYAPLKLRNGIVPLASLGSSLSFVLIMLGMAMSMTQLAVVGVALFGAVVLFQLVNLPVEFNASSRARSILVSSGIISGYEDDTVKKVLNAAAMTYVAATITAIVQLIYFAMLVFGGRRD